MKQLLITIAALVLVGCGPSVDIHDAAKAGDIEAVKQHLAAGSDVNTKDIDGRTPLHRAVSSGCREVAMLLITEGADVNAKDNYTSTPLHLAAGFGHKECVALLIANGATINVKRRSGGTPTPLDYAERAIKHYSHRSYYSPEKIAASKETAEYLRENGARTSNWLRADESINFAARAGHIEAVKQHLAAGVDVKDNSGWIPLFSAAIEGHKEVAELLIEKGVDVNAKDSHSMTTLHHAANAGHKEIVELLIAKGADVSAKDKFGCTPLDLAEEGREHDSPKIKPSKKGTADLLRKHGAKTSEELKA